MILVGPNLTTLPTIGTATVQMVATSPPYFGLRLYGDAGEEIGKERDLDGYVSSLVGVMRECRRVLRDDGCAWVNLGDSYSQSGGPGTPGQTAGVGSTRGGRQVHAGMHERSQRPSGDVEAGNALLVPFRVAAALQADGWTLRALLPWVKIASMPESVQSRPSMAHEYVLFLTKRPSGYFYDADAVRMGQSENTHAKGKNGSMALDRSKWGNVHSNTGEKTGMMMGNPAGRSYRSSDVWRAGAREAAAQLLRAADGTAIGMLTNDDAPAALVVNPKGSGIEHFAMWPTRLVAPMVLAGTPEAGSCSVCGAPWERVVEREPGFKAARVHEGGLRGRRTGAAQDSDYRGIGYTRSETLGFRPSCEHADAPARPAIVLDPFVGAGTTIGVAEALGRRGMGCELYQANADLLPARTAIVRAEVAAYLRERQQGDKAASIEAEDRGQIDMFAAR